MGYIFEFCPDYLSGLGSNNNLTYRFIYRYTANNLSSLGCNFSGLDTLTSPFLQRPLPYSRPLAKSELSNNQYFFIRFLGRDFHTHNIIIGFQINSPDTLSIAGSCSYIFFSKLY